MKSEHCGRHIAGGEDNIRAKILEEVYSSLYVGFGRLVGVAFLKRSGLARWDKHYNRIDVSVGK
jgi:hypothetical protein